MSGECAKNPSYMLKTCTDACARAAGHVVEAVASAPPAAVASGSASTVSRAEKKVTSLDEDDGAAAADKVEDGAAAPPDKDEDGVVAETDEDTDVDDAAAPMADEDVAVAATADADGAAAAAADEAAASAAADDEESVLQREAVADAESDVRSATATVTAAASNASSIAATTGWRIISSRVKVVNFTASTFDKIRRTWGRPESWMDGRSIWLRSPVITIFEFWPRRVRNIFIWEMVLFWASSKIIKASDSVRPRINARGAISMVPISINR
jgi:hypothetical protein